MCKWLEGDGLWNPQEMCMKDKGKLQLVSCCHTRDKTEGIGSRGGEKERGRGWGKSEDLPYFMAGRCYSLTSTGSFFCE